MSASRLQRLDRASHGGSEKPGKLEVGGASRDSTGLGALEEGLISSRGRNRRVPLISDSDRRVPADWGQESQASSWVEAWNSACLSRCPLGDRPLVELYLEPGFFSERCTEKLPLRVDFIHRVVFGEVSGHRVLIKRGPGNRGPMECGTTHEATSGMSSLDRPHPEVRPEGRESLPDKAGESTLLSRSGGEKGLRGGGAGKPRCSSRGRPGFRGTLWVASRVPSALSTSNS